MLNFKSFISYLSLILTIISCTPSEYRDIATYTVSYKNFENSVTVDGFVEPILFTSINSPRGIEGTIAFLVEDGTFVEEGQVVCIIESQDLQNLYNQITISLENSEVGLIKTQADLNMQFAILEAQVRTNDADTKIAQMDSLKIAFMSSKEKMIKELELEKATIEKARYEKKLAALKVIQQSEVKKLELEIQRFRSRVETMKEQLDALTIRAPKSGLAIRGNNPIISMGGGMIMISSAGSGKKWQVGDQVFSNFPIVIIPELEQMKVKIIASESDFKSINVNDSVFYTFDAMPGNTGTGKILKKSPVGQPYKRGSAVKFFEIEASIDNVTVMPEPGLTANCKVLLKQGENTLLVPQIAIFDDDSMKVVFVQRKRGYEKRQVLTGISSLKESVISAGLNEGEVIALSKPKLSLVKEVVALPDSIFKKPETPDDTSKPENIQGFPPGMLPSMPQRIVQP